MSKATINPVAPLTQRDGRRDLEITERLHELDQVLRKCLSYLADLNGCNWIEGDHPAHADMRQRARALQQLAAQALRVPATPPAPPAEIAPAKRYTMDSPEICPLCLCIDCNGECSGDGAMGD